MVFMGLILAVLFVGVNSSCQLDDHQLLCSNETIRKHTDTRRIIIRDSDVPVLFQGLFSGFGNVESLFVQSSKVATIEPGALDLPMLKELNLENNNLREVPEDVFGRLPKLVTLNLGSNFIARFNVAVPGLKKIVLHENQISQLADWRDTEIEELYVGGNPLSKLSGLPRGLKKLLAYNTRLEFLPEEDLPHLEYLNLGDNFMNITEVKYGNLRELYLYNCGLTKVPDLSALVHLQVLNLGDNPLRELSKTTFSRATNLRQLFLYNTQLVDFPNLDLNIEVLNLGDNHLPRVPGIKPSLQELYLYNNSLTEVDIPTPGLRVLSLENNQIARVRNLPTTLERLNVFNNKLSRLPDNFKELARLKVFRAFGNRLEFDRIGDMGLEEVEVNSNQLRAMPSFQNLPKLKKLFLQDNLISHVGPTSLSNLPALAAINLARNQISNIDCGVFSKLSLEHLDLGQNNLADGSGNCLSKEPGKKNDPARSSDAGSVLSQRLGLL